MLQKFNKLNCLEISLLSSMKAQKKPVSTSNSVQNNPILSHIQTSHA